MSRPVRSCSHSRAAAIAILLACPAAFAQPATESPLRALPARADEPFTRASLDLAALDHLRALGARVVIENIPLPGAQSVDIEAEVFDVLTPDAAIVLADAQGEQALPRPDVLLYRGHVVGDPDSRVFLSLSPHGAHGVIETNKRTIILSSGRFAAAADIIIADSADFPEGHAPAWLCGTTPQHNPLGLDLQALTRPNPDAPRGNPCRVARVAIDTDYEYTAWTFAGNPDASAAYTLTLLGAVSEIYTRELNVRLMVPYVRVWTEDVDPYGGDRLGELQAHWNANMGHVKRELAHLVSGNYGGGVAWVGVVCHPTYGYALSGVNGYFPYPLRDHDGGNWDLMVVGHELGHNFGTLHTHDGYDPPIDGCGNGDCTFAWGGTIMSYCHTCAGGMTNIVLNFGPRVVETISNYLNAVCDLRADAKAFAYDDHAETLQDTPVAIDVLVNDAPINCTDVSIMAMQGLSDAGGTLAISPGTGAEGRDEIIYTPPQGYTGSDAFFYFLRTAGGGVEQGNVTLGVTSIRQPDASGPSRAGVAVDYFALSGATQLPDFDSLTRYKADFLAQINYPSQYGYFATSGRADQIGALFQGIVYIPQTGLYTISIESDDGSRLYLGDDLVINNDGTHTMIEKTHTTGLAQGWHRARVEYFDNAGAQGVIVRLDGPGLPRQPIPASHWRTETCVADWIRNGVVDTIDFVAFLGDWAAKDPSTDLNNDTSVNTSDFVAYLNAWVAGC